MVLKRNWWKFLSVLLLLYTISAGLLVPLGPGIYSASPEVIKPGLGQELTITGHNTHFLSAQNSLQAVLQDFNQIDSLSICAKNIRAIDEHTAILTFDIAEKYVSNGKAKVLDLKMNNDEDGTIFLANLVINPVEGATATENNEGVEQCKIEVKHKASTAYSFPYRNILYESIRNLFFHVPMWFTMMLLFAISLYHSIMYLRTQDMLYDLKSVQFINTGLLFTTFGLLTGMLWARFTWGQWWVLEDAKLNGAAILALEYFAYVILRSSMDDENSRAKVSAVYNIFAAASIIPLLYIYPNIYQGLHPANGGNAGFSTYELDNRLRSVFYPAILGFMGLGIWIAQLRIRYKKVENEFLENE